jgi:hypothetical protein
MEATVLRLRTEKKETVDSYRKRGTEGGYEWGKNASYADLIAARNNGYFHNCDVNRFNEKEEMWQDFIEQAWGEDSRLCRCEGNHFNALTESWVHGFFVGIGEFWSEVQGKVESEV